MRIAIFLILSFSLWGTAHAQKSQSIKGEVRDSESLQTIPGVNVIVKGTDPMVGVATDIDGRFELDSIPVGRLSILVKALGFEDAHLDNLLLTSGKQLQLDIKLSPSFEQLNTVEITAAKRNNEALNEMATVSSRSFSVEETQRYAASAFDPSRMALSFAGVVSAGDDIENEISVRGNSPKGILWRMEGIEIPNPNHFSDLGSSGGGISMLSSSTLSRSDFYTGAFPAEFGNATSGVFDLNLRNGNNDVREHSIMLGALGIEMATEGYFTEKSDASYLINYRYSSLAALSLVYQPFGDVLPIYQDLSFKVNIPKTPIGSISFFGLGGSNTVAVDAESDSTLWEQNDSDNEAFNSTQDVGIVGMKHVVRINDRSYLKTVAAYSINRYTDLSEEHDLNDFSIVRPFDETNFQDDQFAVHTNYNVKSDNRNTLKIGANFILKKYGFRYDYRNLEETTDWTNYINSSGNATQFDQYGQWKRRLSKKWTSNVGYHLTYIPFNRTYSIEPRAALSFQRKPGHTYSLSVGLHSRPEHISTYFLSEDIDQTRSNRAQNRNLEIPKSFHLVGGYRFNLGDRTSANAEVYYQYQYDIPIENLDTSIFSMVNASDIWFIVGKDQLISEGKARNYGLDLSVQRSFSDAYYYMLNASVYRSEYITKRDQWNDTRYSGDYVISLLGGKEWQLKRKGRILGLNTRIIAAGGKRQTPFVVQNGQAVQLLDEAFSERVGTYFRFDFGLSYKTNRERSTHTFMLDIQNVTNRLNIDGKFYDEEQMETVTYYQTGIFPYFNYRIEFQSKRKRR